MKTQSEHSESDRSLTEQYRALAEIVCARLAKNERVRRSLPGGGRLRFDRQLPFLCLYRGPDHSLPDSTSKLITTEAAYLFASGAAEHHAGISHLVGAIGAAMQEHFGMFLLLEITSMDCCENHYERRPSFVIDSPDATAIPSTLQALNEALQSITIAGKQAVVTIANQRTPLRSALPDLEISRTPHVEHGCFSLRLAVHPIFRDSTTGVVFPIVLQALRWKLATAIRKAVGEFIGSESKEERLHFDAWGPSALVKAARLIDQQLCEVSESFDFLLQVTPTNIKEAWEGFKDSGYRELPPLQYRYLPYHPSQLKRQLFAIEIERIEDPTLAHLFWEKQAELDRQLTALRDLHLPESSLTDNPNPSLFLLSSLQLYGRPDESLVDLATEILQKLSGGSQEHSRRSKRLDCVKATELVAHAHEEIDHYHSRMSEFNATVELADSIAAGIMVSQHRLLIDRSLSLPRRRVEPLLHHEIGTHLLTYFNGRCQPFRQLYAGLAGYEELQEGLAVLSEFLVGGLTRHRLRTLAARVLAVHWMASGRSFAWLFAQLNQTHGFSQRQAFSTALRVFRGGGYAKDLIYLRGLRDLLTYLASGHDVEPLYVGKIGLRHVPFIQELRRRGIVTPPRILPRFLEDELVRKRLEECRGKSILDLIEDHLQPEKTGTLK
ncbi:hypothetical protein Q31a_49190 [Aureliella helgolandensis]|uniref:Flavohemoglobin expression-modulating QEGLA motif protein n=1 Tax=Aureliella helgolandensis TaxID=2527968 RepID=A0A518GD65_9BACT|nr:hypothetical protein Q31a_49190 [Aureliella helgolandensis]